ncbi:PAS domain S-box protein [Kamptonema formosum]|uniref:PAS domain S-box protein n=1 Tax=Kamptonema formosum TaxID=331992 RepID=UPI000344EF63|nr:PAS domain S-box protein [Oscillatoria sp. PCC 10802]
MKDSSLDSTLESLLNFLEQRGSFDFSGGKRPNLMRSIQKRMQSVGVGTISDYQDYLEAHPEEFSHLSHNLAFKRTGFFQDKSAWNCLSTETVPQILAAKPDTEPIRAWVAGCGAGEDAYTLAITLAEALGAEAFRARVKIYATDASADALSEARHGAYAEKDIRAIPPQLRDRYFKRAASGHTFRHDLRRALIFGCHDFLEDAPLAHIDLLVCRNLPDFISTSTCARLLQRFHFALTDTGVLFLGKPKPPLAQILAANTNLFTPSHLKAGIFAKVPHADRRELPRLRVPTPETSNLLLGDLYLLKQAFDSLPIAQIVVDVRENLAMANPPALALLGLNEKDVGRPFYQLEGRHGGLSLHRMELRSRILQACAERRPVVISHVEFSQGDKKSWQLDIQVSPLLDGSGNILGAGITFSDVTRYRDLQRQLQSTNQELETAYQALQATNEELELANDELHSTNEELESTNEALLVSNEYLGSVNQELYASNEELQSLNQQLVASYSSLEAESRRYQELFDFAPDGYLITDSSGAILEANRAAALKLNRSQASLAGIPLADFVAQTDREAFQALLVGIRSQEQQRESRLIPSSPLPLHPSPVLIQPPLAQPFIAAFTIAPQHSPAGLMAGMRWLMQDITARVQAQEALRESEQRFRKIFEEGPLGMAIIDRDYRFVSVNARLCQMLGYNPEELAARTVLDITHPQEIERDRQLKLQLFRGEIPSYQIQKCCLKKNGEFIWVHLTCSVVRDDAGAPLYYLGTVEDITDRVRAEEELRQYRERLEDLVAQRTGELARANQQLRQEIIERQHVEAVLRESEERFRTMADSAPVLIWISDESGLCTYLNRTWLEFTGRTLEQGLGEGWLLLVHPEDRRRCEETQRSASRSGTSFRMEYRLRRADGQYRWLLDTGAPRFASGRFAGYIGSCVDITERKRAEEQNRFQAGVLSQVNDAVVAIDTEHRITYWNAGAERLYGYLSAEVFGRRLEEAYQYRWHKSEDEAAALASLAAKGFWRGEVLHIKNSGEELYVEASVSLLRDERGAEAGLLGVMRDISARKRAEAAVRQSEEQLQRIFEESPIGIALFALPDYQFFKVNQAFCNLLGYAPAELAALNFLDITHPDNLREEIPYIQEVLEGETNGYKLEKRLVKKNKDILWGRLTLLGMRDQKGDILYFVAMVEDVSERHLEQTSVHSVYNLLPEIAAPKTDLFFGKNIAGYYVMLNTAYAQQMFGLSVRDVLGKNDAELFPPEIAERSLDTDRHILRTGEPETFVESFKFGDAKRWFLTLKDVCRDRHGNVICLIGMMQEISEAEARKRAARLQENLQLKLAD